MNLNSINTQNYKHQGSNTLDYDTLIIDCSQCSNNKNIFFQDQCISCLSLQLFNHRGEKIKKVYLKTYKIKIEEEILALFIEFFICLENIQDILKNTIKLRKECLYVDFDCPIFNNSILNLDKSKHFYNPIFLYERIQNYAMNIREIEMGFNCTKCHNELSILLNNLLKIFSNLEIIKNYKNFKKKRNLFKGYSNYYEYVISNSVIQTKEYSLLNDYEKKGRLIEQYKIGENKLYKIAIYKKEFEIERKYTPKPFFANTPSEDFFKKVINYTKDKIELIKINRIISLGNLIESYKNRAIKIIDLGFNLDDLNKKRLGMLVALKVLKLEKIFPLLLDDNIEEIFLDSPQTSIYLNHQRYFRCRTAIKFDREEIERIVTMLRLYSGNRLDHSNPSLQYVIKNRFFYCRFSIDISPINFNEFSLDIRKLNKNIFTIQDLLKNETLNSKMAAFFYFCILNGFNFTVTGETDSGKTTLINSFDLITPKELRKIYVENVIESLSEVQFNKHQVKFKVSSFKNRNDNFTKSGQIKTLLHRSPDIIFLGEILTKEESEAMFHCLAAGLRGFQTIHANSITSLINRFIYHFKIKEPCLNDLDLIIMMKKGKEASRKIISVAEVSFTPENGIMMKSIFNYDPRLERWDSKYPLFETKVVKKMLNYEYFSKEKFNSILDIYTKLFELLASMKRLKTVKLIRLFDKVSFFSKKSSLDALNSYLNGILK